jgi:lysophospholipase L1-like esterase
MRVGRTVLGLACAAALLGGCGGRPTIHPLDRDSVVVAFGDSLTAGTGAEEGESYPAVLAGLLGCRVVNAGVPGEVTAQGVRRLPAVLAQHKPDLVVLCHGGNDLLQHVEASAVAANLQEMVEAARSAGADVLVIGVPQPGLFLKAPPFYAEVARRCGVPCDAKVLPEILAKGSLKSDTIHPNAEGYRRLAQRVAELIRKSS